jgi:hypothetical protein
MSLRMTTKVEDNIKFLYKSELDIIYLIRKSEPLTNKQIEVLMDLVNKTKL